MAVLGKRTRSAVEAGKDSSLPMYGEEAAANTDEKSGPPHQHAQRDV